MKRIFTYVVLLLLLASCTRDKGNYEYIDLKEPVVTGLDDSSVLMFSRLVLTPDLGGADFPSQEYSFQWKALNDNGAEEGVVIGTDRNLDYEVTLLPGSYTLFFTITQLSTGLYWQYDMNLLVSSATSEGWMVLCSEDGRTRLDVISAVTGETVADILRDNGMPELGGPRRIIWLSDKTDAASPY